jgi:hypothetical protein
MILLGTFDTVQPRNFRARASDLTRKGLVKRARMRHRKNRLSWRGALQADIAGSANAFRFTVMKAEGAAPRL